jgi:hypothetical protein
VQTGEVAVKVEAGMAFTCTLTVVIVDVQVPFETVKVIG